MINRQIIQAIIKQARFMLVKAHGQRDLFKLCLVNNKEIYISCGYADKLDKCAQLYYQDIYIYLNSNLSQYYFISSVDELIEVISLNIAASPANNEKPAANYIFTNTV
ncbi:hypothetical protein [Saccharobesus litoralis]|nr:hypothetical protein [Saccharobesus litoralis]